MNPEKNKIIKFHWSFFCVILTIGINLLLIFLMYRMLTSSNPLVGFFFSIVIILLFGYIFLQCPVCIIDSVEEIEIKLIGRTINVRKKELINIQRIDRDELNDAYRAWGSGGYFGFTGKFKNPRLGLFYMYATELNDLLLIETEEKKYIISCSENIVCKS